MFFAIRKRPLKEYISAWLMWARVFRITSARVNKTPLMYWLRKRCPNPGKAADHQTTMSGFLYLR
ncbi:hypothetical protein D3C87_1977680 [compost metagenome]